MAEECFQTNQRSKPSVVAGREDTKSNIRLLLFKNFGAFAGKWYDYTSTDVSIQGIFLKHFAHIRVYYELWNTSKGDHTVHIESNLSQRK